MRSVLPAAMGAMLAVVGCGRLDYDLVGADEDAGHGVDRIDAGEGEGEPPGTVDAHPAADGAVAVTFPTDERRLTAAQGASLHPVAVWSGTALYVVWDDDRNGDLDVYLSRLT